MKKWILYSVGIMAVLAIGTGIYIWFFIINAPHRDIESAKPDFTLKAEELIAEFDKSDTAANSKYSNKVVQFTGTLSKIEPAHTTISLVFDYGTQNIITAQVLPKYKNEMQALNPGTILTVKGLYNGIIPGDEMFDLPGSISLNKCSPIK